MVSPNKKRSFLPTLPCAKTGRRRKERWYAEEDGHGGSSSQAPSAGMAGFLEAFGTRSDVARTPTACEERDGSPHPLVAQAHHSVLVDDGLVDPGTTHGAVSRGARDPLANVLPPPAVRRELSGTHPGDAAGRGRPVSRLLGSPSGDGSETSGFGLEVVRVDSLRRGRLVDRRAADPPQRKNPGKSGPRHPPRPSRERGDIRSGGSRGSFTCRPR